MNFISASSSHCSAYALLSVPFFEILSVVHIALSLSKALLNSLDHLIAHASSFREARSKVSLDLFEFAAVAVHVAKRDTFGPVLFKKIV